MNLNFHELKRKFENLNLHKDGNDSRDDQKPIDGHKIFHKQNSRIQKSKFDSLKIEDFQLFSTLGTGTFGRVRLVKLKKEINGDVYALKMLKKTEIVRLNQVEHIKSEKCILQKTKHPFLVSM